MSLISSSEFSRGRFDRHSNANISSTTAQIATHRFLDIFVRRLPIALEQCNCAHDLAALTVPALHNVLIDPRILHYAPYWIVCHRFDRVNGPTSDEGNGNNTRTRGHTGQVDCAGAA